MSDDSRSLQGMAYVPGRAQGVLQIGPAQAGTDTVVLIDSGQIAQLTTLPAGILVRDGAPLSHQMIRLLGMGVPTVMVSAAQAAALTPGQPISLDGASGRVGHGSTEATAATPPPPKAGEPVHTADGTAVYLNASVRDATGAAQAVARGAHAIGLVRSEFLEPGDGTVPDGVFFETQFAALCRAADPLTVAIRLLDASDDKRPAWLPAIPGFGGALGLQGVRLFGTSPVAGVIDAQVQAIARLAASHRLQIILPFVTRAEELQHWVERLRPDLPESVTIGAMVETPAAALDLAHWFDHADFLAVGCNDLMQCLFAADRDRPQLAGYLDPYAPLLYRFFRQMAEAAGPRVGQIQLCGLLPQLQGVLPLLIGLGYRRFSVDPPHIPYLADTAKGLNMADAERLATQACEAVDSRQLLAQLDLPSDGYRPFVN